MFRFSLQRILDYRRQLREKAENEVRIVREMIREERNALSLREGEVARQKKALLERGGSGMINVAELSLISVYLDSLRARLAEHRGNLRRLEARLKERMAALVRASQEEKVMERLREKELRAYRESETRAENRFLDEIAIRRYRHESAE